MREMQSAGLLSAVVIAALCSATVSTVAGPIQERALQVTIRAFQCNRDGFFRDPYNCTVFYRCADLTGVGVRFQLFRFDCPPGTVFDANSNVCDHPQLTDSCAGWPVGGIIRQASKPALAAAAATLKLPAGVPVPGSEPLSITANAAVLPGTDIPIFSQNVPTSVANQRCRTGGLFRNPNDCSWFHICVDVFGNGTLFQLCEYPCPSGTVFSNLLAICTEPANAEPCIGGPVTPTPAPTGTAGTRPTTSSSILPSPLPTAPTTARPTGPLEVFRCTASGYFRHPSDCTRYYQCLNLTVDGRVFQRYEFTCGPGTVFDESVKVCNHPVNVPGCGGTTVTVPSPVGSTFRPGSPVPPTISTARPGSTTGSTPPPTGFQVGQTSTVIVPVASTTLRPVTASSPLPPGSKLPPPVIAGAECSVSGLFRHSSDCARFFRCVNLTENNDRFVRYDFTCGLGSVFDPSIGVCNHPSAVPGCEGYTIPPSITTSGPRPLPSSTVPTVTASPLPPVSTLPTPVIVGAECSVPGLFRHASDCARFFRCVNLTINNDRFIRYDFTCGLGTVFDSSISVCNHPSAVPGCEAYVHPTPDPGQTPSSTASPITLPTSASPLPPISTLPTPVIAGPECSVAGLFRYPKDCARFFRCVNITINNDKFIRYDFVCGPGSVFDQSIGVCNHPSAVPGCEAYVHPTPDPGQIPSSTASPITLPTSASPLPPISTLPTPVIAGPECSVAGLFRHPKDCARFFRCVNITINNDKFIRYDFVCGLGSVFDQSIGVCNHPSAVPGCEGYTIPTSIPTSGPEPLPSSTLPTVTAAPFPPISILPTPVPAGPECSVAGLFRHPYDCARFFRCVNITISNDKFIRYDFVCGLGSVFDQSIGVCNHPSAVTGCEGYTIPTASPTTGSTAPPAGFEIGQTSTVIIPIASTTSRTISTLPTPVIAGSECTVPGLFRHPNDCARFFRCVNLTIHNDRFIRYDFVCGLGSVFDPSFGVCNHPSAVSGCEGYTIPPSITTSSPGPLPSSTVPTVTASPLPPVSTLPTPVIAGAECSLPGLFRHASDCARFFRCVNLTINNDRFIRYDFTCGLGTVFDSSIGVCNHPSAVPGCEAYVHPTPDPGQIPSSTASPITLPTSASPLPPISTLPTPVIAGQECSVAGLFRHPTDCARFFRCVNVTINNDKFIRYDFICGPGSVFDQSIGVCNHPNSVPGCEAYILPIPDPGQLPSSTSSPITLPTSASPLPPITTLPTPVIAGPECSVAGLFRHPKDCARFFRCVNITINNDKFIRYDFACGPGTVFDQSIGVCNHPSAVPGCEAYVHPTPDPGQIPSSTASPITLPTSASPLPPISTLPTPVIAGPECSVAGLFRHPTDCARFFRCVNITINNDKFIRYDFACGPGTVFDQSIGVCNHPSAVPGCEAYVHPTPDPGQIPSSTASPITLPTSASPLPPISTLPTPVIAGPECSVAGLFRHPTDCARFFRCVNITINNDIFIRYDFVCGPGTVFDQSIGVCNHPSAVPGCEVYILPIPDPGQIPSSTSSPITLPTASPLPPISTLPTPVIAGPECSVAGLFRHPNDCARFFRCVNITINNDKFIRYDFVCGLGSVFDQSIGVCNHPSAVPGCEGYTIPTSIPTSGPEPLPSSTLPTVTATPFPPISILPTPMPAGSECSVAGLFRHPNDCARFFHCVNITINNDKFIRYDFVCGPGTVFDQSIGVCNHPSAVPGCEVYILPIPDPGQIPSSTSSPITLPTSASPLPPISTLPTPVIAGPECSVAGLFRHPNDCARFFRCVNLTINHDRFIRYDFVCGLGSVFDPSVGVCNHPSAVPGCEGYTIPTSIITSGPEPLPSSTSPTVTASPFPPISTVPTPVIAGPECSVAGLFRHPNDCTRFFRCVNITINNDKFIRYDFLCGPGTVFDQSIGVCNHPSAVPGCEVYILPIPDPGQIPSSTSSPITLPTSASPLPPISTLPTPVIAGPECSVAGLFRHPTDCARFFQCVNITINNDKFILYDFVCGLGSVFDQSIGVCNHPSAVPGCEGYTIPTSIPTSGPEPLPSSTLPTVTISSLPPISTLPTPAIAGSECTVSGLFRHPTDCARFFRCVNITINNDKFIRYDFICGPGSVFDQSIGVCNHPSSVPGCEAYILPIPDPGQLPSSTSSPITLPTSASPLPPISTLPTPVIAGPECSVAGLFRHPKDCARFFRCVNITINNDKFIRYDFACGPGTVFDQSIGVCNHPSAVPGCEAYVHPTPDPGQIPSSTASPITLPTSASPLPPISTLPTPVIAGPECSVAGLFRHPTDCARFFRCVNITINNDKFIRYDFACGPGTVFDQSIGVCNHPSAVPGCESYVHPTPDPGQIPSSTASPITLPTSASPLPPISTLPTPVIAGPECSVAGLFRHPTDCARFFRCVNITINNHKFIRYDFACGPGTVFDQSIGVCNHPSAVPGCEAYVHPTPDPGQIPSSTASPITLPTSASPLPPISTLPTPVIAGPECSVAGLFRHPNDCARFFRCVNITINNDKFIRYDFVCGPGSVFDQSIGVCNHPSAVPGCEGYTFPTTLPTPDPGTSSTLYPGAATTPTSPTVTGPVTPPTGFGVVGTSTIVVPITTATRPTFPPVIAGEECTKAGTFRHPHNCVYFYRCVNISVANDKFVRYDFMCGPGTVFDESVLVCNHPSAVPGCEGHTPRPGSSVTSATPVSPSTARATTLPGTFTSIPTLPTFTPHPPVLPSPPCDAAGYFPHPLDCSRFYRCVNLTVDNAVFQKVSFVCANGTVFDPTINICNHPFNVPGCENFVHPTRIPGGGISSTEPAVVLTSSSSGITSSSTSTPSPRPVVSPPRPTAPACIASGFFRHPTNCSLFYRCINITSDGRTFQRFDFSCGHNTVFDPSLSVCNHPASVPGCEGHPVVTPATLPPTLTPNWTIKPVTSSNVIETSTITISPTSPVGIVPITPTPGSGAGSCFEDGFFRHPNDCTRFFRCVQNNRTRAFLKFEFACGSGSVFDLAIKVCNHPSAVPGCEGYTPSPTLPCATNSSTTSAVPSPTTSPATTASSILPPLTPPTSHGIQGTSQVVPEVTVSTAPRPTTPRPLPHPFPTCIAEGLFRHPRNCSKFVRCVDLTGKGERFQKFIFNCPPGTYFDSAISSCNHKHLVACSIVVIGSSTTGGIGSSTPGGIVSSKPGSIGSSTSGIIGSSTPGSIGPSTPGSTASSIGSSSSTLRPISSSTLGPISSSTLGPISSSTLGPISSSTLRPISSSTAGTISSSTPSSITTASSGIGSSSLATIWPGLTFQCIRNGKFEHRYNCARFYLCQDLLGDGKRFHLCEVVCPQGTYFDKRYEYCSEDVTLAAACIDKNQS